MADDDDVNRRLGNHEKMVVRVAAFCGLWLHGGEKGGGWPSKKGEQDHS